jgi:hypothetical protein
MSPPPLPSQLDFWKEISKLEKKRENIPKKELLGLTFGNKYKN